MSLNLNLPDLDGKKTQRTIEAVFEKYRIYMFTTFEEQEASITASYDLREGSSGGGVTDQTGRIATYNVDTPAQRKLYMEQVKRCVSRLPGRQKTLVETKYMSDAEYVTDLDVSCDIGVSLPTYAKIRRDAFYKLAFTLSDMRIIKIDELIKE